MNQVFVIYDSVFGNTEKIAQSVAAALAAQAVPVSQVDAAQLRGGRRRWLHRTPAIAAGITDHLWTVKELLSFRVPPPPWKPPRRRGRPSRAVKALIAQWCS